MNLEETYKKIKPSIVAFIPKYYPIYDAKPTPPVFPPIIGTGFIVADGLVVTNDHVVQVIKELPRPKGCPPDDWPIQCLLLYFIPNKGMAEIYIDVIGVFSAGNMNTGEYYYGPQKPDIAFVHIKMKDLPHVTVKYNPNEIIEGRDVATAGFTMGTETLMAPGYLHQITPTLQKGIISAVLPFDCKTPHALMINIMTQGGASGSPVFLSNSDGVIGILYAGLNDSDESSINKQNNIDGIKPYLHSHLFNKPTNASYVVPSHFIINMLGTISKSEDFKMPMDTPSLKEMLKNAEFKLMKRGDLHAYKLSKEEKKAAGFKLNEIVPCQKLEEGSLGTDDK